MKQPSSRRTLPLSEDTRRLLESELAAKGRQENSALVDADEIDLADMGGMLGGEFGVPTQGGGDALAWAEGDADGP